MESPHDSFSALFAEELGFVIEVEPQNKTTVIAAYQNEGVSCQEIGKVVSSRVFVMQTLQILGQKRGFDPNRIEWRNRDQHVHDKASRYLGKHQF